VRRREFFIVPGERPAQLLEAGVRELNLGLDACRTAQAEVLGVPRDIAKQSRLANAGFPPKHENASPALAGRW
jgi:hypothetical protein